MTVTLSKIVLPSAKRPDETRSIKLRFTKELADGESLQNATVIGSGLTISSVSLAESSAAIAALVGGGTAGTDYDITFQASTTLGQLIKRTATLSVQNEA